ncbi:MAG: hypothetical protein Ct9H90mP21_2730 [Methanobacteriota archaeon]|nr:MAG: hypothetical protein Ct9H90mP21_2730 [Euryarchaeota archaeon]
MENQLEMKYERPVAIGNMHNATAIGSREATTVLKTKRRIIRRGGCRLSQP